MTRRGVASARVAGAWAHPNNQRGLGDALGALREAVEVNEGDLLLQRWAGWRSWLISLVNGGWSHVSILVRGADGEAALIECTARAWTTVENVRVCPGVGLRPVGRGFDGEERCRGLAIARVSPPLSAAELLLMRAWLQKQLEAQRAAPERSLYDAGTDLVLSPFGCGVSWTADRFTCSEFVARAYAATGRWPSDRLAPLIPGLLDGLNARVTTRL